VLTIDELFAKANVLSVIWSQEDPGNDPIEGAYARLFARELEDYARSAGAAV
jgi:hypothetical protein